MKDIDSVKAILRKLLNVTKENAATEGEIESALAASKKLMEAHHLSEEDLGQEPEQQYRDVESAEMRQQYATIGNRFYYWENCLSHFVSEFVGGVGVYRNKRKRPARNAQGIVTLDKNEKVVKGVSFVFYGAAEDVEIATELFLELRLIIMTMARLKFGGCFKGDGGYYAEGFVTGLNTKLAKNKRDERLECKDKTTALVLIERRQDLIQRKEDHAKQWLSEQAGVKLRTRSGGYSGATGRYEAFTEGKSDGKQAEVNPARTKKLT